MKPIVTIAIVLLLGSFSHAQTVNDIFPVSQAEQIQWIEILENTPNCVNGVCRVSARARARSLNKILSSPVSIKTGPRQLVVERRLVRIRQVTVGTRCPIHGFVSRTYHAPNHTLRCRIRHFFKRR